MFTHLRIAALAALSFLIPNHAMAQDTPVVVELYTSQGCSSCPPADKLLHELAERDGVIALALHVDYWDYIGWKDVFADPAYSQRQRQYARRAGNRMVYTPQIIIGGKDHVVGTKPMEVADLLAAHASRGNPVEVSLKRSGRTLSIAAEGQFRAPADVHIVRYAPRETVRITRGENRGRTLSYANTVRSWDTVAQWDGRGNLDLQARISGDLPVVVLVQEADYGPILGAAALR